MLDLLLRLVDRCIDLAKRRDEINRSLYNDFVLPVFSDVEAVHKDYLDSLRHYREAVEKADRLTHLDRSILDSIAKDRMFSQGLICKVTAVNEIRDVRLPDLVHFIRAVDRFLYVRLGTAANTDDSVSLRWPDHVVYRTQDGELITREDVGKKSFENRSTPRSALIEGFTKLLKMRLPQEEKKRRMLQALDTIVEALQANYTQVVHEHLKVRKKALRLR